MPVAFVSTEAALPLLLAGAIRRQPTLVDWATSVAVVPAVFVTSWASLAVRPHGITQAIATLMLLAVVALQVARPLSTHVAANARATAARELQTRFAAGERLVATAVHDELASLARAIEQSRSILLRAKDGGAARLRTVVDDVLLACDEARRSDPSSAFPDVPDPADESSSFLVDRWGRVEKTPGWWPMSVREVWAASIGSWLDSIRLLHTRDIERLALAGTLYLRAALMLMLPGSGFLMIDGVLPFGPGVSPIRDAGWAAGSAWALAMALGSPWVVGWALDRREPRALRALLAWESLLGACVLLATPSWIAFAFLAGPVNWLMRPRWRLGELTEAVAGYVGLLIVGLALAGQLRRPWSAIAEVLAAVSCLSVISNSFGLLFPLVVAHALFVLPAWHLRSTRFQRLQWRKRAAPLATAVARAVGVAAEERAQSPAVAEVEPQLARAKIRLDTSFEPSTNKPALLRRRAFGEIVKTGLDRAARDPEHPIRCAAPMFTPPELSRQRFRSWRVANHFEIALARIAAEAVRHGEFEIRCRCIRSEDAAVLYVSVENDLPVETTDSTVNPGRGAREIAAAVAELPAGQLLNRGFGRGVAGISVFEVQFSFAAELRVDTNTA